jgi:hypothetical protein
LTFVSEQDYSVVQAADEITGLRLGEDERSDLARLRKEDKKLRMEKEILKKVILCYGNEVNYRFFLRSRDIVG